MFSFETLFFLLLVIVVSFSIRRNEDEMILSRKTSINLRGVFSLLIMIFHISKENDLLYPCFEYLSIGVVGAFFFLSGYGIMCQYIRNDDYGKIFITNRLIKTIIPYTIITLFYWLYNSLTGNGYSLLYVANSFIKQTPIVTYSWFIVSIIEYYIVFWIILLLCKDNRKAAMCVVYVLCVISVAQIFLGFSDRFLPDVCFCVGIAFAYKEDKLSKTFKSKRLPILAVSLIITLLIRTEMISIKSSPLAYYATIRLLFISILLSVMPIIRIESRLLSFFGRISFELYLTHGLSKMIVRRFLGTSMFIQDLFIFSLSIIMSTVFEKLFKAIEKHFIKENRNAQ